MQAYLGIGTNLGDKTHNIEVCLALIKERVGTILRQSSTVESEPWGYTSQNTFLNLVVCVDTSLSPHQLLNATQQIEQQLGRTEKSANEEYKDRIIDIDILLYEDIQLASPDLTIPHPLILARPFVYKPLQEILPTEHIFSSKLLHNSKI